MLRHFTVEESSRYEHKSVAWTADPHGWNGGDKEDKTAGLARRSRDSQGYRPTIHRLKNTCGKLACAGIEFSAFR